MLTMETHFPFGTVTTEEVETVQAASDAFIVQKTAKVSLVYLHDQCLCGFSRIKGDWFVRIETYGEKHPLTQGLPNWIPDVKMIPVLQQLLTA